MKVCFYGLGSIGRRHLINLTIVCSQLGLPLEVHAYRSTVKTLDNDILARVNKVVYSESELDDNYDIAFITNPTVYHYKTISDMLIRTKHMFIEKPLFDTVNYDVSQMPWREGSVYYVATPLRYTGVVKELEKIVKKQSIYSVRVICSSYLPDWRQGVDYRENYSAKRSEGGGVRTDIIHEWDYITHLFGFPEQVNSISGTFSELEIDSEDIAVYIAAYKDKLIELHLDYFGRVTQRKIELYTPNGLITGDFINNCICYSDSKDKIDLSANRNDMYMEEMRYFLNMVMGVEHQPFLTNVHHAFKVLKLSLG